MFLEIKVLEKEHLICRLGGPRPLSSSCAYALIVNRTLYSTSITVCHWKWPKGYLAPLVLQKNYTVVAKKGQKAK